MNAPLPTIGTRVRLRHALDRYPHFIVEAGALGTVSTADENSLTVRMDDYIPGCEDWENEIIWIPFNDPATLDGFWDDCEVDGGQP